MEAIEEMACINITSEHSLNWDRVPEDKVVHIHEI